MLVSDCGSSLGWLSIAQGMFPCLRPRNKYLILRHGVPSIARGPECLVAQGIGIQEANATNLFAEDDKLLRTLAGNAVTANICCAFFRSCPTRSMPLASNEFHGFSIFALNLAAIVQSPAC